MTKSFAAGTTVDTSLMLSPAAQLPMLLEQCIRTISQRSPNRESRTQVGPSVTLKTLILQKVYISQLEQKIAKCQF